MRVALFCIARSEDRYIDEWIRYNLKLGFDAIFVSCDRWLPESIDEKGGRVHWLVNSFNPPVQVPAYHQALIDLAPNFDFVAFFDVDEFLVLKKHKSVKDFLFGKKHSVAVNWHLFGDSGLTDDGSMGVLQRFTMRGIEIDHHVKCIVRAGPGVEIWHPHYPNAEWLGSDGLLHTGPFCENGRDDVAQLNHFFCKTWQEWQTRRDRGRSDSIEIRPDSDFGRHNLNEIEDLTAKEFLYGTE